MKDTLELAREPNLNLKGFLQSAYIHPVFKGEDEDDSDDTMEEPIQEHVLVKPKRQLRRNTPLLNTVVQYLHPTPELFETKMMSSFF